MAMAPPAVGFFMSSVAQQLAQGLVEEQEQKTRAVRTDRIRMVVDGGLGC
jgi:hypothetical protein